MKLRGYQEEAARAILDSVYGGRGLTFSVEIARQGGKNELSAHLELLLLTQHLADGGSIGKCSPTIQPQTDRDITATLGGFDLRERLRQGIHPSGQ